ncbi:MAG: MFS transporter [Rubrobacteraceae bacterium]
MAGGSFGPDFWKFFIGQAISNVGSSFTLFALPLLVFKLTGSALNLAFVTAAEFLPYLLFGLVIGAGVDRVDRRRLMIFADLTQALVISSIPLIAVLGTLSVWWIYAVGFVSSTLWIFFNTAEFAVVPSLVAKKDLVVANGRLQAVYSAATIAGPLLAGALLSLAPIYLVLFLDALSFLLSAFALKLIKTRFDAEPEEQQITGSLLRGVSEGLGYVFRHPVIRNISIMMAIVNCVGYTVYAQLILFAKERLLASDAQVGVLYAAGSLGMVVLALASGPLRRRMDFSKIALGTLMIGGVLIVLLAFVRSYWLGALLWASIWGLVILFQINSNSLWQAIVPNRLLGRVQSVILMLSWSAIPVGTLAGGVVIEQTRNVALVYGAIGVVISLSALAFSFTALGRAERYLPRDESPKPGGS